jgi:DedD protein
MASLSAQEELIVLRKRARRRLVGAVALVSLSTLVLWNVVGHIPNRPMKPEKVEITANGVAPGAQAASAPVASAPAVMTPAELSAGKNGQTSAQTVPSQPNTAIQPAPVPQATTTHPATVAEKPLAPAVVAAAPAVAALAAPSPKPKHEAAKPVAQDEETAAPVVAPKPKPHPKPVAQPKVVQEKAVEHKHKQTDPAAILEGRAESADTAQAANSKQNVEHKGNYLVQLAALTDPAKADALKAKLSANGINARFSKVETSKGEVTRVRMGPFASRAEADAALRKLAKAGVSGIVVSK